MVVAEQLGRFDTIGIDCMAMNVNDLICVGAEPIAMLDFILCREADPDARADRPGLRARCRARRDRDPGGEIAQVGDVVSGWELGGSAIGLVALDEVVTGERDRAGRRADRAPLLRPALERLHAGPPRARRRAAGGRAARAAARRCPARAHRDLRPRRCSTCSPPRSTSAASPTSPATGSTTCSASRADVGYEIDDPLPVPPVFALIRELGGVVGRRDARGFQHGLRFVCVVAAADEDAATALLAAPPYRPGESVRSPATPGGHAPLARRQRSASSIGRAGSPMRMTCRSRS